MTAARALRGRSSCIQAVSGAVVGPCYAMFDTAVGCSAARCPILRQPMQCPVVEQALAMHYPALRQACTMRWRLPIEQEALSGTEMMVFVCYALSVPEFGTCSDIRRKEKLECASETTVKTRAASGGGEKGEQEGSGERRDGSKGGGGEAAKMKSGGGERGEWRERDRAASFKCVSDGVQRSGGGREAEGRAQSSNPSQREMATDSDEMLLIPGARPQLPSVWLALTRAACVWLCGGSANVPLFVGLFCCARIDPCGSDLLWMCPCRISDAVPRAWVEFSTARGRWVRIVGHRSVPMMLSACERVCPVGC